MIEGYLNHLYIYIKRDLHVSALWAKLMQKWDNTTTDGSNSLTNLDKVCSSCSIL